MKKLLLTALAAASASLLMSAPAMADNGQMQTSMNQIFKKSSHDNDNNRNHNQSRNTYQYNGQNNHQWQNNNPQTQQNTQRWGNNSSSHASQQNQQGQWQNQNNHQTNQWDGRNRDNRGWNGTNRDNHYNGYPQSSNTRYQQPNYEQVHYQKTRYQQPIYQVQPIRYRYADQYRNYGYTTRPQWVGRLHTNDYNIVHEDGRDFYILNQDSYNRGVIVGHPRSGVVQIQVQDRTLEVIEATRLILDILR